jgi:hypothetical protein
MFMMNASPNFLDQIPPTLAIFHAPRLRKDLQAWSFSNPLLYVLDHL